MCGPSCLLIVSGKLGIHTTLEELAILAGTNRAAGTTMLGLKTAAEAKGMHAMGMKIGANELANPGVVAIAHLWANHFVVVEGGLEAGSLMITDPPAQAKPVPLKDFEETYSGFAILVAKDESAFPRSEAKGPDLRVDNYDYDFGFIEEGTRLDHTFSLKNKGIEDLMLLNVETTCTCTQATLPNERRIPPGGEGELVVGFDSEGRRGPQSQIVTVHSNDPISPVVRFRIGGDVQPARLAISKRSLDFGTVRKRDSAKKEMFVTDTGNGTLIVRKVTSDSPFVQAALASTTTTQPLSYPITVVLRQGTPVGELRTKITVYSNHAKEPVLEVPVSAVVVGDIDVFPDQFFLGLLKKGQSASKKLTLSTTSDEPLTIQKIDNPCDYVIVTAAPEVEGKKYTITATLKGAAPVGLTKQVVVVHTNDPDQPEIKIPLFTLIQD